MMAQPVSDSAASVFEHNILVLSMVLSINAGRGLQTQPSDFTHNSTTMEDCGQDVAEAMIWKRPLYLHDHPFRGTQRTGY